MIDTIEIHGNKKTKAQIILRECKLRQGELIDSGEVNNYLKEIELNLKNTSLFNFVHASCEVISFVQPPSIKIIIQVTERWYLWPIPITIIEERNFNEWWKTKNFKKLSYGLGVSQENFRGRKESLLLIAQTGFNNYYGIQYSVPYVNQKQAAGFGFSGVYSRSHNIVYSTEQNKLTWLYDDINFSLENLMFNAQLYLRRGIHKYQRINLQFNRLNMSDTLLFLQPDYIGKARTQQSYFSLSYFIKFDYRDYMSYPLHGYYIDAEFLKRGFGCQFEHISTLSIVTNWRKYFEIRNRLFLAGSITAQIKLDDDASYIFSKALGYGRDFVRGYENYVIDGQDFVLAKSNIKYNIIKPSVLKIPFLKWEKFNTIPYAFYVNAFADCGTVRDRYTYTMNPLSNSILFGYGLGLDFVTYYDGVFRMEVSRNLKNEFVFSVHFIAGI